VLSRGGYELNEIWERQRTAWLIQENLNELHKTWKETGTNEARGAWHAGMKKAGLGDDAAKIIMKPHVEEFRHRRKQFMGLVGQGRERWTDQPKRSEKELRRIVQARHDYEESQRSLAKTATEIGHHNKHGHFLAPKKDQHPLEHVDELAHAYGQRVAPFHLSKFKQRERFSGAETTVNSLPHHEAAQGFDAAVQHHHGDRIVREKDLEKFEPGQRRPIKHTLRSKMWQHQKRLKGDQDFDPSDDEGDEWKTRPR